MKRHVWIGIIVFALTVLSAIQLYPPFDIKASDGTVIKKGKIKLGLDLQGGMFLKLAVDETKLPKDMKIDEATARALEILRNRIDQLGVAEPIIQVEGDKYIVIQLPGIKDEQRALDIIGKTALLEFRLVSQRYKISDMTDANGNTVASKIPEDVYIVAGKEAGERYVIEKKETITGADLVDAKVQLGNSGEAIVGFKLSPEGGRRFAEITGDNVGRNLAIVLDDTVYSAPTIRTRISGGEGIIEGNFTTDSAKDLALILRAGALPAPVKIVNKYVVGATLGTDSINKGKMSVIIGMALVVLFMAVYYGMSGVIADFAVFFNVLFILAVLSVLNATLTLPGIAGIVLTVGMAVDANVLILERIREEMRAGKTIRAAIDAGYNRAIWAVIDSHVTSLITAAILFQFGTGTIRGFAVTLSWGVIISLFTAVFITKAVFDMRKQYTSLSI